MVFTSFTHAGGAGKTTLVRDVGYELAKRGYKVLAIDLDPQANLSTWLGVSTDGEEGTVLEVIRKGVLPEPIPLYDGFHLVPANILLAVGEVELAQKPLGESLLRAVLKEQRDRYDIILVDSLPSLGKLALLAALAGDGLIVPVEMSPKGLQAAVTVLEISRTYMQALKHMGQEVPGKNFVKLMVPTKYDPRTHVSRGALDALLSSGVDIPIAPPISLRPGAYGWAAEHQLPLGKSPYPDAREEVERVTDFLIATLGIPSPKKEVAHG